VEKYYFFKKFLITLKTLLNKCFLPFGGLEKKT
jgi:hypothetical protein